MTKCGDKGIHDFEITGTELYAGEDGGELMKRQVKCKDCDRKALEYYLLLNRIEIHD